ncbi:hypothetical protein BaRGS_00017149 [Batillaria attramentaria]|uniref:Uncharacterized protein n=1 Tax=Batillaria attramentaria TaxID=370345 RepID=A0ABD0KWM0_9CAEN
MCRSIRRPLPLDGLLPTSDRHHGKQCEGGSQTITRQACKPPVLIQGHALPVAITVIFSPSYQSFCNVEVRGLAQVLLSLITDPTYFIGTCQVPLEQQANTFIGLRQFVFY